MKDWNDISVSWWHCFWAFFDKAIFNWLLWCQLLIAWCLLIRTLIRISDAGIPVWATKLYAKIKRKLGQNNISLFSFIFQANVSTHYQTFRLNNTLKSTDLRILCMTPSTTLGYLNVLQYINCINKLKLFIVLWHPN